MASWRRAVAWIHGITPDQRRSILRFLVSGAALLAAQLFGVPYLDVAAGWLFWTVRISPVAGWLVFVLLDPEVRRWIRYISIDQWRAIDRETVRTPDDAGNTSLRILAILATVCIVLTLQEYTGGSDRYARYFPYDGGQYWELKGFMWWSGWRVLGYVVIPMIVIAILPGERLRDYHVSLRGFLRHLWIYVVMFLAILPLVILASKTAAFRHTYPFYRMANRSQIDLWSWEALYAAQFVSLEFFFRGFLLQGLRRALGANAIFVMIVPYCMIHYGKPMPETLGAIGAGLILGTLAMRTRSIWGGVLIHIGVATTMDVLALRGCPPMESGAFCHE
jgi:membrane protease YdiL (CAAX protease family)